MVDLALQEQLRMRFSAIIDKMRFATFVILIVLSTQTYSATATGPLRVSKEDPRYFTDGSGRAIYLTGSHNWMARR